MKMRELATMTYTVDAYRTMSVASDKETIALYTHTQTKLYKIWDLKKKNFNSRKQKTSQFTLR